MPRAHITGALFISLALVVGALWSRFSPQEAAVELIAINKDGETVKVGEMSVEEYLGFGETQTETGQNLDETELLSRQLLSEYFSLSSRNENTSENFDALGKRLANSLLSSQKAAPTAKIEQIKVAADSNENLLSYNQKLLQLRAKYASQTGGNKEFESLFDGEFTEAMSKLSALYAAAAQELLGFSVPASLAENHLRLINNYLSTSHASLAVSQVEKNPVTALSALNTLSKNSEEEEALISIVKVVLMSKGLYSGNI
jgi:hypothetical protein